MKNYESLSHTRYDCKYHVVFIPKYRRRRKKTRMGHIERIGAPASPRFRPSVTPGPGVLSS